MSLISFLRSRTEFISLLKLNSTFLLIFLFRRWDVYEASSFFKSNTIILIIIILFIYSSLNNFDKNILTCYIQNNNCFFIFHFEMHALVVRLRIKVIICFIIFFEFMKMTSFVRLIISIKLIIEKFIILILIIVAVVIFTRATQSSFLHNNFKQYNFFNVRHILHDKKLVFKHGSKFN